jgi:hypothetical protein
MGILDLQQTPRTKTAVVSADIRAQGKFSVASKGVGQSVASNNKGFVKSRFPLNSDCAAKRSVCFRLTQSYVVTDNISKH